MTLPINYQKTLFILLVVLCLFPIINAPIALILGFVTVNVVGNPFSEKIGKLVKTLLKYSIVGLGFGMNFHSALRAGKESFALTLGTIVFVLVAGILLGILLKNQRQTSYLIASGTAICGGSAIAAVSPIINASPKQISVALGTVFTLNAIGLLIFPLIGHYFELSQYQFGLWSAVAIHDTSSVVGAASAFGNEALKVATTVKLGRALWIIPLSMLTFFVYKNSKNKIDIPYFILFFILAMVASTYLPQLNAVYELIVSISRQALVVTLFLIGAGLSFAVLKSTGAKTFAQGLLLWILVSVISLIVIIRWY